MQQRGGKWRNRASLRQNVGAELELHSFYDSSPWVAPTRPPSPGKAAEACAPNTAALRWRFFNLQLGRGCEGPQVTEVLQLSSLAIIFLSACLLEQMRVKHLACVGLGFSFSNRQLHQGARGTRVSWKT